MHRYTILLFVLISFFSVAQHESAEKVKIDGITYYQHTVVAGNTLYSLQKEYGVSKEEILKLNPELESGLKVGQKILIPIAPESETKTVAYKVKKKETLYGLSKKFNISIDELIRLNPELKDGLKKGQVIRVPKENVPQYVEVEKEVESPNPFVEDTVIVDDKIDEIAVSFEDSIVDYTVKDGETMYSISKRFMVSIDELMKVNHLKSSTVYPGQTLMIPLKKEGTDNVVIKSVPDINDTSNLDALIFEEKEKYNIVIMLPFYLGHGQNYSKYVSNLATQFYMGTKFALDSLKEKGLNAKVYVFDTKNDSSTIVNILRKNVFDEVDLVIGPLLKEEVNQVAEFCKQNKIRMVCPVSINQKILKNNRLVYSAVTSNIALINGMATFLSEKSKNDRIILVKPSDEKSIPYYNAFVNTYRSIQSNDSPVLIETTVSDFNVHIQKSNKSHIVVPTVDKKVAMKFVNNLNKSSFRAHPGNIQIYGMKEWRRFTEINSVYMNKYNFHFSSPSYLNYKFPEIISFNKAYRNAYKTDLPKMSVQGYDVTLFFVANLLMKENENSLLMNDFQIQQISDADGYENVNYFIIKQEDFELIRVN